MKLLIAKKQFLIIEKNIRKYNLSPVILVKIFEIFSVGIGIAFRKILLFKKNLYQNMWDQLKEN